MVIEIQKTDKERFIVHSKYCNYNSRASSKKQKVTKILKLCITSSENAQKFQQSRIYHNKVINPKRRRSSQHSKLHDSETPSVITSRHAVIISRHDAITSRHDVITFRHDVITSRHDVIAVPHDVITAPQSSCCSAFRSTPVCRQGQV